MCTVTFFKANSGEFVLTSNRDELVKRKTVQPAIYEQEGKHILYPKDKEAGGTWIAVSSKGVVCCLLNGGFDRHERKLPYRKSRGVVLLDVFNHSSVESFLATYNLEDIEPFTLIILDVQHNTLVQLVWTGVTKHIKDLNISKQYIWSSTSLYSKEQRELKSNTFNSWLFTSKEYTKDNIYSLHAKDETKNGFIMQGHKQLETVSITQITANSQRIEMSYLDLLTQSNSVNGLDVEIEDSVSM